ncbi:MAG: PP2C family protein-serine/threonine phosphatase [Oscillatoriales cyanobacterium RM1_1_9]|nr:PP2C family protein-serine/threonine phosphatase [Oscillatoriales cyanobacterium SM2_3_0]NJO47121.1 PP2C family protein-serine/threonine phosphatase [Oscillatoriales cyanobacterium RM2_1_1]NJO72139.1 PP2C family protein-serine/threonine phosphatase [Oscillatoriales cyanobacterium RM1_1_9]
MTALPLPSNQSSEFLARAKAVEASPVKTLKELVARLQREQHGVNELLSSLGFALRSFNNLNQFLELTPLVSSRVTDADGGALILLKPNGQLRFQRLHCQDGRQCQDIRQALELATRKVSTQPSNSIEHIPPGLLRSYISNLDHQVSHFLGPEVKLFGTPVLVNNVERGRLYVFSHNSTYRWTPTRQKLMRLIADQTAVAISNDELAVSLREKERLDRELEIGAEIQLRLLPRQCPTIEGIDLAANCITADRVGGDYYDFIPSNFDQPGNRSNPKAHNSRGIINNQPWGIVIGDVMGKGVPAGLIMTMTRGMLRAEVLNRHSPARILQHLNRVMYADLETSSRFVTLFYSEYNPASQILSYSNAAHNPPLFWQASSRTIQQLDTLGMLIGLDADTRYYEAQVQLRSGDTILYYTDGVTDAANQRGDRFDEERLHTTFRWACENCRGSQAVLDYIFQKVDYFVGPGSHNTDDMTLVVMQVRPVIPQEDYDNYD